MRDFRSDLNIIGLLLCIQELAMMIPMITDLIYKNSDWQKFFFSSFLTILLDWFYIFHLKKIRC